MLKLFFPALFLAGLASAQEPLFLGVLEGSQVRVAFQYEGGKWSPMPGDDVNPATMASRYPRAVTWTVAFDGRNIGTLKSEALKKYSNREQLGLQELTAESRAWVKSHPHARKLVVVSRPNFQDPDQWKPYAVEPNSPALTLARDEFRELARKEGLPRCDCSRDDVRVCSKPYRSAHGDILIGVGPQKDRCNCYPSEEWFLVRSGKAIHFESIYGGEDSLHLIDAGDYDGSGVSQALFFAEGVGDARDTFQLLSLRDASVTVFTLPGPYTY